MKNDDPEAIKKKNREHQSTWAGKWRSENLEHFKESQKDRKSQSRLKLNDENYDRQKDMNKEHQSSWRERKKSGDPEGYKVLRQQDNAKHRKDKNEKDRLKKFLDATCKRNQVLRSNNEYHRL